MSIIDRQRGDNTMTDYILGAVESRFADNVWTNAPITTAALVKRCADDLSWKRTTTYTVLKKLCEHGFFRLEDGVVTVVTTKEEYDADRSEKYIAESFSGSLPAFIAAFTKKKSLTEEEIAEIRAMIDGAGRE